MKVEAGQDNSWCPIYVELSGDILVDSSCVLESALILIQANINIR